MEIYSVYNHPRGEGITFELPTRTQQHFKDECDINNLMERYVKTGTMPQIVADFQYGDYTEVPDYRQSIEFIMHAQDQFDQLPAKIRKEFNNNPAELLDFLNDPANKDEAIRLGLIERPTQIESSMQESPSTAPQGESTTSASPGS